MKISYPVSLKSRFIWLIPLSHDLRFSHISGEIAISYPFLFHPWLFRYTAIACQHLADKNSSISCNSNGRAIIFRSYSYDVQPTEKCKLHATKCLPLQSEQLALETYGLNFRNLCVPNQSYLTIG